ncbi:MAG: hypothetical protein OEZ38_12775, partial [Gammaproteobacteria bacterium]|nr:hypothetical protein [Gammaproteobacteria bacterium]
MSLLLDALKKVERNKQIISVSSGSNYEDSEDQEVNLDLDLVDDGENDSAGYKENLKVDLSKRISAKDNEIEQGKDD